MSDAKPSSVRGFPSRQIHLDFHTSPMIPEIGADFDADQFAATMKAAHVNSVTVFAKCHHGHLYYNTDRAERHPGLAKGFDLLRRQVDALHKNGIRAPIYISVQCDEYAADTYPEWIARDPDGKPVGAGPYQAGWQILDMSSPYQDFLAEQTREVLAGFDPVDGIFFDMCWDQPSSSNYAVDAMKAQHLDPESAADRQRYAHAVSLAYMDRFFKLVKAASPDAGVYFNSRPLSNLAEEVQYLTQVEIEALPTGGWGYMYFPRNVRFARAFGRPYLGMTARFHKSWADFGGLKPRAALEYETAQMLAHGARCSIGDQLHPRGTLDKAAYELIGSVYGRVQACEPWCEGAEALTQIGVFEVPRDAGDHRIASKTNEGVTRVLTQLRHQFDVLNPLSDWNRYELLILPDSIAVDAAMAAKLEDYVSRGGALLFSGHSGLSADARSLAFDGLGVKPSGLSPFTTTYMRFGEQINADVPPTDHVQYERGIRVTPDGSASSLGTVVEPYFERTWEHFSSHFQTPPSRPSVFPIAVLNQKVGYIAYPIFEALARHGSASFRLLIRNVISLLLSDQLLTVEGPTSLETTVTRQPAGNGHAERTIVHLLQYCPERRAEGLDLIEDVVPIFDLKMSLRLAVAPRRVYSAPDGKAIPFEYVSGRLTLRVPQVLGHAMIVFE
jgi:hypothetical protein